MKDANLKQNIFYSSYIHHHLELFEAFIFLLLFMLCLYAIYILSFILTGRDDHS